MEPGASARRLHLHVYLLHMPLFLMWARSWVAIRRSRGNWLTVTGLMLASVVLIGRQTEAQRYRLRGWLLELSSGAAWRWPDPEPGTSFHGVFQHGLHTNAPHGKPGTTLPCFRIPLPARSQAGAFLRP